MNKLQMKWHHFLRFVLLPLTILIQIFILGNVIADVCGITLIPGMNFLTRILSYAGVSMNRLGGYLLPLICCIAYLVFVLIMMLYAEIGLLARRKYGKFCHNLYLITNSILFIFLTYCFYANQYHVHDIVIGFLRNTNMNTEMMVRIVGLLCILFTMGYIAYTAVTISYYHKRRFWFKNRMADGAQEVNVEQPLVQETIVEEPVVQTAAEQMHEPVITRKLYCPNCGRLLTESDVNFCTNCGAKIDDENA